MAEYRSGHYPEAEQALSALQTEVILIGGTADYYRAMSLFHRGKAAEARQLFNETEGKMKPLPADENNPMAGGGNCDDLILWLACKEAKALLQIPAAEAKP